MCIPDPSSEIAIISSKFGWRGRPLYRAMLIGILCILSFGCGNYEEYQHVQEVKKAVRVFIEGMNTSPSAEDKSTWGLNQLSVFGPPLLWENDIDASLSMNSPLTYRATAAVWYRGTTPGGQSVREQRTIVMHVKREDGAKWRVTTYELSEVTPLSFWKQLGYWILWSYLGPLFFLFITAQWSILWQSEPVVALILTLFLIGAVIWSGVVSYYSFGSGLAVVACIPIFVFINLFLIGLLRARNRR